MSKARKHKPMTDAEILAARRKACRMVSKLSLEEREDLVRQADRLLHGKQLRKQPVA